MCRWLTQKPRSWKWRLKTAFALRTCASSKSLVCVYWMSRPGAVRRCEAFLAFWTWPAFCLGFLRAYLPHCITTRNQAQSRKQVPPCNRRALSRARSHHSSRWQRELEHTPDLTPNHTRKKQGTPARTSAPYTTREVLPARTNGRAGSRWKRRAGARHAEAAESGRRGDRARRRANAFGRTRRRGKKGNLHRRAATRGGMRGGARRVRWGTASPPQPGLYLAAGHTRRRRATSQASLRETLDITIGF